MSNGICSNVKRKLTKTENHWVHVRANFTLNFFLLRTGDGFSKSFFFMNIMKYRDFFQLHVLSNYMCMCI